ncbi:hypothetical protein Calkr_2261 [Caldicellulosiruptor acetigenus I77R1B]|uniref:Uncharacterized protein n=2 Tax=Caldicellulosiruptor acetigenus TaxID=301953 RepID=G2PWC6_9FIRM|nr:hypothetical protein [Caldicellulosiruptor acetigenus]ADQ41722.1 hypothetical protein Calkr_2261 [Caldicellulosiruptor acetigenus I77R1B]AEM72870.1 hypothetical protein Calla_0190 [Caldicellulosiruptor acetigenus 6A]WAM36699.1 hypothetical protein OTK01_000481 [Caldicellulosiruptor acetigenus]
MRNPRDELYSLIDKLTTEDVISLLHIIKRIVTSDEELTDEEIQQIELAKDEIAKGEGIEIEEVKKILKLNSQ